MNRDAKPGSQWIQENRQLCKLILAHNDIMQAWRICPEWMKIGDNLKHELHAPLFTAIVISYGRAFGSNRPFGGLPLRWSKFSDSRRLALHNTLLALRNEEYAHSDASRERVVIIPPGYRFGGPVSPCFGFACSTTVLPAIQIEEVQSHFLALAKEMAAEINLMIHRLYAEKTISQKPFGLDTHGQGNHAFKNAEQGGRDVNEPKR